MSQTTRILAGTSLIVMFLLILVSQNLAFVLAATNGQCYPSKQSYEYNETVIIFVNTSTGINNAKIVIYLPNGQINTYTIGMLGVGVWQFPLEAAGPLSGQRTVALLDGSTILDTTYYTVMPSNLTAATSHQTVTRYRTTTVSTTVTHTSTISRLTSTTLQTTTVPTTLTESTTATKLTTLTRTITNLQTVTAATTTTEFYTVSTTVESTLITVPSITIPGLSPTTLIYALFGLVVLLILGMIYVVAKLAKK
jgi:hypothetical protein